ncbi:MlaD family protein [Gordonia sp. HY002]|uniref:MlaD family protein n=1 Tax=Gordonia zhenghanii TaxID=2911516 RepID=UPI001EF047AD|nr:MlaD family protein [Gordonia zhenghanii]MCF8571689.1 MlaD family protein [Gordonia zhenghanii]MCF8602712.1 MlaD family protein [Gordonia zhenghanii]
MKRSAIADKFVDLLGAGPPRGARIARRQQIGIGLSAVAVLAVISAVLGVLYVVSPGYQRLSAEFVNASGVRAGDQVRIAGIRVGSVESLDIDGDRVHVRFTVREGEHIGSDTAIAVRLLTPVGGRFLQVKPKGGEPLGDGIIPAVKVTGTYDLSSILEQATPKMQALDGSRLRTVIDRVHEGMTAEPWLGRDVLDATANLASQLATRADQMQTTLQMSDEYVAATAADRKILFTLIASLSDIGSELGVRHVQVRRVFNLLKRLIVLLERPVTAYAQRIEGPVNDLADLLERLEPKAQTVDKAVGDVESALSTARTLLGSGGVTLDQGKRPVTGVDLCVPSPGKEC